MIKAKIKLLAGNLGQDQEGSRIDTHYFQCINLLGDTHRAKLGRDVGPHFSGQNETHDTAGELQDHDLTSCITCSKGWHPRTLDVDFYLDADNSTNKKTDQQDDADGVHTQLCHLLDILFDEHAPSFGPAENFAHQF